MSWDKYNEARRKAREAMKASQKIANTGSKNSTSNSSTKNSVSSEVKQAKTAYKNAKTYKWTIWVFLVIAIISLATLPFSSKFESIINNKQATTSANAVTSEVATIIDNSGLKVHYVDIGQGDCIMLDFPDGKNMIIDSGSDVKREETCQKVLKYIDEILLDEGEIIDYLILTHPDSDHLYYMPDILDAYEVATIYRPYCFYSLGEAYSTGSTEQKALHDKEVALVNTLNSTYNYNISLVDPTKSKSNTKKTNVMYDFVSRTYTETFGASNTQATVKFPIAGEKIQGAEYTFTFYAPITPSNVYSSWNDYSSVMVLEYKGLKMAFTGDAEKLEENEILANQTSMPLPDVDIMDMGHHGSRTSSQPDFVNALNPEYAIISCGKDNKYKHPNQETLDTLHASGVDDNHIYITANNGDIVIGLDYVKPAEEESSSVSADAPTLAIGCSGEKSIVDTTNTTPTQFEIKWYYVVIAINVFSAMILFIVIPSVIKSTKKSVKKIRN